MNILKYWTKIIVLIVFISLYSCTKEKISPDMNTITDDVEKVISIYKAGDVKIETIADPNNNKIETDASDTYKKKILQILNNYTKQTTYLKSGSVVYNVGVIKVDDSCGPYLELDYTMDCEDSGNNSQPYGWVGKCDVNSSGNVTLRICMVDRDYFNNTVNNYAVLNFSAINNWQTSAISGPNRIIAQIDNEDSGNINGGTIDGVPLTSYQEWLGDCHFYYDTQLGFYNYPAVAGSTGFPAIGIHYGVFGSFGANQGRIHLDDEDHNNADALYIQNYNKSTNSLNPTQTKVSTVSGIIDQVGNTDLYMSRAM